ncbi:MAG TPA: ABC transporter ATP-binding protein [Verrucomicrobiae bacterium]
MASVVLENLTKTFLGARGEAVRAVSGVNLSVPDGELLAVVGPTGCGKTTLLRLIAGLESPTAGKVLLNDNDVTQAPPKHRDVAMVFQHHALFPHLTARENITFGLRLRKHAREEIEQALREVAGMLDLEDCLDRRPAELSGGQRQRVALARAVVRHPKAFLLDEALSHLDAPLRAQLRAEIARLHRRLGATLIYVTHDQAEAMVLGTRLAVMRGGVLEQVGEPLAVYQRPANLFVAGFIGSPPMNLFRGVIAQCAGTLSFREQAVQCEPGKAAFEVSLGDNVPGELAQRVGQPVLLGVRPEHFSPGRATDLAEQGIPATVETVEQTGADVFVHLATAAHTFVARLAAETRVLTGQQLRLTFPARRAHFFDPATGARLE